MLSVAPLSAVSWSAAPFSAAPLNCVSSSNQECRVRRQIANVSSKEPVVFLLVLKQVNAVVVVIISM